MHGWDQVAVRVKRQRDRRMAEHLGDKFDMHTRRQKQSCRCVPHVVEADSRQTGRLDRLLEDRRLVLGIERRSERAAEDEILIPPFGTDHPTCERLAVPVGL